MLEMSGVGATTMGIGVSHSGGTSTAGGGDATTGTGCRLRAQSQSQASTGSASQRPSNSGQGAGPQGTTVQQQQRHGIMGRSKKDNCCLCWCCCCSCSLAAVSTGGSGGAPSMRLAGRQIGGGGDHGGGPGGLSSDHGNSGAGNGLEGDIKDISLEEIRSWGSSFDRLMRNPAGRQLFREFLVSEYSDENIAFWLACENLKRESNPDKVEEKARSIYEDYISIISPKEVSLDSRVREIVNRNMTRPTPHTFDEAQLQIYTLMHRDSYPRFVNSELYQKVARISSGPPSPCIDAGTTTTPGPDGTITPSAPTSSSQTRKSKKSIT